MPTFRLKLLDCSMRPKTELDFEANDAGMALLLLSTVSEVRTALLLCEQRPVCTIYRTGNEEPFWEVGPPLTLLS